MQISKKLLKEEQKNATISVSSWREALRSASLQCRVYGDSAENIGSIAISYCRMLRKGLIPTADQVLFTKDEYHSDRFEQMTSDMDRSTVSILECGEKHFSHAYDRSVFSVLYTYINKVAPKIERYEREREMYS